MIDPVSGAVTGEVTTPPKSSEQTFGAGMGKDTFLKLLVAQLKYQNPLSPTNSEQFMAQMAQFTQVEKLAEIGKAQNDLVSWQRTVAGQGMIGKQITATSATGGTEVTGLVTGVKLTDAGPRLILSNGTTVGVDEVTSVEVPNASTGAQTPAIQTPATPTPATPTPPTNTPAATTPATTPPATTPAAGSGSAAGSATTGTGSGTGTGSTSSGITPTP